MDVNTKVDALVKQVDKLQLQIDAICKHYGIGLDYQPHNYNVYANEQEDEGEGLNG